MQTWQLQEAKNKLSQVVDDAIADGPQVITRHGQEVAVVLAYDAYRALTAAPESLVVFFRQSPLVGEDLDLQRDPSPIRDAFRV
jgi:prevent-host-death family protein